MHPGAYSCRKNGRQQGPENFSSVKREKLADIFPELTGL